MDMLTFTMMVVQSIAFHPSENDRMWPFSNEWEWNTWPSPNSPAIWMDVKPMSFKAGLKFNLDGTRWSKDGLKFNLDGIRWSR